MKAPFYQCQRCLVDIAEMKLPITPKTKVPVCPTCLQWDQVDVVLGDAEDVIGDADMVLFDDGRD